MGMKNKRVTSGERPTFRYYRTETTYCLSYLLTLNKGETTKAEQLFDQNQPKQSGFKYMYLITTYKPTKGTTNHETEVHKVSINNTSAAGTLLRELNPTNLKIPH